MLQISLTLRKFQKDIIFAGQLQVYLIGLNWDEIPVTFSKVLRIRNRQENFIRLVEADQYHDADPVPTLISNAAHTDFRMPKVSVR
jgi:hypothetical protein